MPPRETNPQLWLVASVLAGLLTVGAGGLAVAAPPDLLAVRVLAICVTFGALIAAAQFLAAKREPQPSATDRTRRIALVVVGAAAVAALLWTFPWIGEFTASAPAMAVGFQVFMGVVALFIAAITVWGVTRPGPPRR